MKIWICAVFCFALSMAGADVPRLTGHVNDYAAVLTGEQKATLESTLATHESISSDQVVILTVPSLEGETIEDFANKVFRAWKLGQKGKNNGILIVYSKGDRKTRIEVGRGLEGAVNDAKAGRIIRDLIAPSFRANRHYEGLAKAVDEILSLIKGENNSPAANDMINGERGGAGEGNIPAAIIVTVLGLLLSFAAGYVHMFLAGMIGGVAGGFACAFLGMSQEGIIFGIVFGFILGCIVRPLLKGIRGMDFDTDGGYSSSSSSWSSSSSDSYSGGGGDSGGGGASGDT